jgi:hypothetical protein
MINPRVALLGAALAALPLTVNLAHAAPPPIPAQQLVVYDAAGHAVGVLTPFADPVAQIITEMNSLMPDPAALFAEQAAMMRQVALQMRQMESSIPAGANAIVVTSIGNGQQSCSRTVTYAFTGNNPQPQVEVRQVGDACGDALPPGNPGIQIRQPQPAQPQGSKLIEVDYRHPAQAPKQLRG